MLQGPQEVVLPPLAASRLASVPIAQTQALAGCLGEDSVYARAPMDLRRTCKTLFSLPTLFTNIVCIYIYLVIKINGCSSYRKHSFAEEPEWAVLSVHFQEVSCDVQVSVSPSGHEKGVPVHLVC